MSLPTCPSCGQSVLEDDALDCPFCGAAMDGSRGAKNTPRPKANPVANRPGARKPVEKPATPTAAASGGTSASTPSEPPKPISRPISGPRGARPQVDEDDPFGIGGATLASQAIQASARPEKGKLQKVVCPMCETVGFVAKTAVGKSVRCANEKCMVPVFTATDPSQQTTERKPSRLSDEAEAARKAAEAARPAKRNPMVVYGVVGGVLLLLTMALLPLLTTGEQPKGVDVPIAIKDFGPTEDEIAQQKEKEAKATQAAIDAVNPVIEVKAYASRMIAFARQANVRDKAWARRMTGDVFLRLGDPAAAAAEFNQLLTVDKKKGFYQVDPLLADYWRALASNDKDAAAARLKESMTDRTTLENTGRDGTEAAIGLAAVLFREGQADKAIQLIASRQLDRTVPHDRDTMASTAWGVVASRHRDASLASPPISEALTWSNPLHLAVAVDLAIHDRWSEAIAWSRTGSDSRSVTDALVAIADLMEQRKASPEVVAQLESAINPSDVVASLRVRGAVAAATKDAARLDSCVASLASLPNAVPAQLPSQLELVQNDVADRSSFLFQSAAVAEVVRAAVVLKSMEHANTALNRLLLDLSAVAPPTSLIRVPINQMATEEPALRKRLATELRVDDEKQFAPMFRSYRKHMEQFAAAAEDRRLMQILLLSRIVRAGGVSLIQKAMSDSAELKNDLMLDELSGFLAVAAYSSGQPFAEVQSPDASLRNGRARFGNAQFFVDIAREAALAWSEREQKLPDALRRLDSGAGIEFPGLRQAIVDELVESAAGKSKDVATVLTAISQLQNKSSVWKEEAYTIAGHIFADRQIDKQIDAWTAGTKLTAMESVALLYGISLGILERPIPVQPDSTDAAASVPSGKK